MLLDSDCYNMPYYSTGLFLLMYRFKVIDNCDAAKNNYLSLTIVSLSQTVGIAW
jgi:hypothetical protein